MKFFTDHKPVLSPTREVHTVAKGLVKKTLIPVFILISLFFVASCGDQSTFEVKGIVARRQLELFWIIFGLGVLVFVIVEKH